MTQEDQVLLNDILIEKDITRFKEFLTQHKEEFPGLQKHEGPALLKLLYEFTLVSPLPPQSKLEARKFLRNSQDADQQPNPAYSKYAQEHGEPTCRACQWYVKAPFEEEKPCVDLGAHPDDPACKAGFHPS